MSHIKLKEKPSKRVDILTVLKRLDMKIVGLESLSRHCCSKNWPSYADVYIVIYVHVAQVSMPEPVGPGPAKSIKNSLPNQNVDISLVQSLLSGRILLFNCSTPPMLYIRPLTFGQDLVED